MLQKRSNILIVLASMALALLAAVSSCDNGCEQMRESFMHISLTSNSSRTLRSLYIDAHGRKEGMAMSDDTTLQYTFSITSFDDIELELNPNDTLVTFVLRSLYQDYGDKFEVNDTVRISYTANGRFLDMECGCTVDYEINTVSTTHHLIEEVRITDSQINTESGNNLELIY